MWLLVSVLLSGALVALAVVYLQPRWAMRIVRACAPAVLWDVEGCRSKCVALTIDDVPGRDIDEILEILNEYEARATFFVIGSYAAGTVIHLHALLLLLLLLLRWWRWWRWWWSCCCCVVVVAVLLLLVLLFCTLIQHKLVLMWFRGSSKAGMRLAITCGRMDRRGSCPDQSSLSDLREQNT